MQTTAAKLDVSEVSQVAHTPRVRPWYKHLSVQILLAMVLGVIVGYVWPGSADALEASWRPLH